MHLLIALVVLSSRRLKPKMPVMSNCSLAISVACHPPKVDDSAAFKSLLSNAVAHEEIANPGHCCLTSFKVEKPRKGALYAGC